MSLNDILLHIDTYPEPTPPAAIDFAVDLSAMLGLRVSALALEVEIPLRSNRVADYLIHLSDLARAEEDKGRRFAREALERFAARARLAGVVGELLRGKCDLYGVADEVAKRARTHDLCIVPVGSGADSERDVAQAVIFGSGRPVLVFDADHLARARQRPLGEVIIAWDGGAGAARALCDALPILNRAADVRLLTVVNEKPLSGAEAADAQRHLARYGIDSTLDEADAAGRPIGEAIDEVLRSRAPDLLVMGAYGHSRLRELVLGGATEHMLNRPIVPVLMAH